MLAPEISAFGDGAHDAGETGLTVDGGGFGAFPGELWMYANADRSGAADQLTVGAWNDIELTGVAIPGSPNNVDGTVYLFLQREDLAWSQGFEFTLGAVVSDPTRMDTSFLAAAVPSTAVFKGGAAYAQDGSRYVAALPANPVYIGGIAHRQDGAMCINVGGTIVAHIGGWGMTDDGEVVATTSAPTAYHGGKGFLDDGSVCMTEVS